MRRAMVRAGILGLCATALGCAGAPVSAPGEVTATLVSAGIQLTWEANTTSGSELWVERKPALRPFARIASLPGDAVTYLDGEAQPGVVYSYRVLALDAGMPSNGTYSKQVTVDPRPMP